MERNWKIPQAELRDWLTDRIWSFILLQIWGDWRSDWLMARNSRIHQAELTEWLTNIGNTWGNWQMDRQTDWWFPWLKVEVNIGPTVRPSIRQSAGNLTDWLILNYILFHNWGRDWRTDWMRDIWSLVISYLPGGQPDGRTDIPRSR